MPNEPVVDHVPADGSYSSALDCVTPLELYPAAIRTLPLGSNVAVCTCRTALIEPVFDHVPAAGSYNSALERVCPVALLNPPATSTFPFGSSVAV